MRAMAAKSAAVARRMYTSLIAQESECYPEAESFPKTGFHFSGSFRDHNLEKKTPRQAAGAFMDSQASRSAAIAKEAQQHEEQVDEVEIEPQRSHHRLLSGDAAVVVDVVHLLDALGVVGGETDEYEHGDHRDRPVEPSRTQKDVDQARDDDADQAHEHERA